jgi:hypothetical protein
VNEGKKVKVNMYDQKEVDYGEHQLVKLTVRNDTETSQAWRLCDFLCRRDCCKMMNDVIPTAWLKQDH